MRQYTCSILAAAPLALAACSTYRADPYTPAPTSTLGPISGRSTLSMPVPIQGSPVILVPYSVETHKWLIEDSDPYSRRDSYKYGSDSRHHPVRSGDAPFLWWTQEVRWHNAIVIDTESGQQWNLLENRAVVARVWAFGPRVPEAQLVRPSVLLFYVVTRDTNANGQLENNDAGRLLATDGSGRNPRWITPEDAQVWDVSYDPDRDAVYAIVVRDTDRDGNFAFNDEPVPYAFSPRDPGAASPIVSDDLARRVRDIMGAAGSPPPRR